MIASLMMYARPELAPANERLWSGIRSQLADAGIASPARLSNKLDPMTVWTDPTLVLSQTCGMPYRMRLHDKVSLVGTPDYGLESCPPGYYRSAIVVRASDDRDRLAAFMTASFAYNEAMSQSGLAAAYEKCAQEGFWFSDRRASGGHVNSARMVAEARADVAAIDAVTWTLIQRYETWAHDLRVLTWTEPTPGLPLITAQHDKAQQIFHAVSAAIDRLDRDDKKILGIRGLVQIPKTTYLAVPTPPEVACELVKTNK